MMRLKNREIGVPDQFRFTHSETGHRSVGVNWWAWEAAILSHRRANNLDIPPNMMAIAEDQLCRQLDPEWCERSEKDANSVSTRFTIGDLADGIKAYAKWILGGFRMVDQVEAERRAFICGGCFLNVNPQGCGACNKMGELITGEIAQRKTPYDPDLKACAVCRCPLKSIVHFPMDLLEQSDTPEKQALYPKEFCWRAKESPNYAPNEQIEAGNQEAMRMMATA